MQEKINMKFKEDILREQLKSYDLGTEFDYAVAVLNMIIDGEKLNTLYNIITKVQYMIPFVSRQSAENYCKELSSLSKITLLLPIGEDGKVVIKNNNIFKSC